MKKRVLLSAIIGAGFVGIFYPTSDWNTWIIAIAVSFFLQLGILFCTMLIGTRDAAGNREKPDQAPAADTNNGKGS